MNLHLQHIKTHVDLATDLHLPPLFSRKAHGVEVSQRFHFLEEAAEIIWRLVNTVIEVLKYIL